MSVSKLLKFHKFLIILHLFQLELFMLNVFQIIYIHIYLINSRIFHLTQNILLTVKLLLILNVLIIINIRKIWLKIGLALAVTARIRKSIHILKVKWILLLLVFLGCELFINLKLVKLLVLKRLMVRLLKGWTEYPSFFKLFLLVVIKLTAVFILTGFWLVVFIKCRCINHPILNILIV